ncbi:hyalin-like [Amphiura filiformis]|uniref:hyalin-like n=1 Tax=Amphiura filiformis TaxID=82378 RepID=UPI003B21A6EA
MTGLLFILLGGAIYLARGEKCYTGSSIGNQRHLHMTLTDMDPCLCTSLQFGGKKDRVVVKDVSQIRKYLQVTCEIPDGNDCDPNPCYNDGSCGDGFHSFNCTCPSGYTGVTCLIEINECLSSPCQNGASCVDGIDSFTCYCLNGFDGETCSIDVASPEISCYTLLTSAEILDYTTYVSATDNGNIQPEVVCELLPKSVMNMINEMTSVFCIATDGAGNKANCSFDIIIDQVAPDIMCSYDIKTAHSVVNWTQLSATDNIDGLVDITCIPSSGSYFERGNNTVVCSAMDTVGNVASCYFYVIVDVEAPSFTCPATITSRTPAVRWDNPSVTDNADSSPVVTCVPSSGSSFRAGITMVTCIAIDHAGNENSCNFNVDAEFVILTCPGDMDSVNKQVPEYAQPTVSGNTTSVTSIDCFPEPLAGVNSANMLVACEAFANKTSLSVCTFSIITNGF